VFAEFDSNEFPLAYFITFRTYGTWLHGDSRGSIDRQNNTYGRPLLKPDNSREQRESRLLAHAPVMLTPAQRKAVERDLREVCQARGYVLLAVNVRTNHVHVVTSAACKPEPLLNAFKSYSTRKLRELGLISEGTKPWVRHGSTRYLWKEPQVEQAISYVLYGQGDDCRSPTVREGPR